MQILGTVFNLNRHIKHPIWYREGWNRPISSRKENKATRDQIHGARRLGEDLIREDLCDEDDISASQEHDTPGSPNPYDASVSRADQIGLEYDT